MKTKCSFSTIAVRYCCQFSIKFSNLQENFEYNPTECIMQHRTSDEYKSASHPSVSLNIFTGACCVFAFYKDNQSWAFQCVSLSRYGLLQQ